MTISNDFTQFFMHQFGIMTLYQPEDLIYNAKIWKFQEKQTMSNMFKHDYFAKMQCNVNGLCRKTIANHIFIYSANC